MFILGEFTCTFSSPSAFKGEVSSEEGVKKDNRMGGNIPGGNFLGGNFPGGNFSGGNFPRTIFYKGKRFSANLHWILPNLHGKIKL